MHGRDQRHHAAVKHKPLREKAKSGMRMVLSAALYDKADERCGYVL
jgi:hypothetical protein